MHVVELNFVSQLLTSSNPVDVEMNIIYGEEDWING